jgi:hypothetical protein
VYDLLCMQILETKKDLTDHDCSLRVVEASTFVVDEGKEVTSSNQLLEDVDVIVAPENLFDTNDIWMDDVFQDVEFTKASCYTSGPDRA